ncbi:hypothetical protein F5Y11DRAFT_362482 [Daldinia sp. FL1419]|nr:hypothetical protein F5Y11DRAFT_362482 [Daldinia sp. FL1419]
MANPGQADRITERIKSPGSVPPNLPAPKNRASLPQYFIVRPGTTKVTASGVVTVPGPLVPLIAVDQLPEWFNLVDVPRELTVEQTVGLRNLGTVSKSPETYQVFMCKIRQAVGRMRKKETTDRCGYILTSSSASTTSSEESGVASSSQVNPTPEPVATSYARAQVARGSNIRPKSDRTGTNRNENISSLPSPLVVGSTPPTKHYHYTHPSAITYSHPYPQQPPIPFLPSWYPPSHPSSRSRTNIYPKPATAPSAPRHNPNNRPSTYCKHWCHRGTCRWGVHCRYAHEMPSTLAGLRDVGLAHHPAWYTAAVDMAFGPGGFAYNGHTHTHNRNRSRNHNRNNNNGNGNGNTRNNKSGSENSTPSRYPPWSAPGVRYNQERRDKEKAEKKEKKDAGGSGKGKGVDGKGGDGMAVGKGVGVSDISEKKQPEEVEKLVEI